jgi:hypothetical protein
MCDDDHKLCRLSFSLSLSLSLISALEFRTWVSLMFTKSGTKPMNSHNYVPINFGDYIYSTPQIRMLGLDAWVLKLLLTEWNCYHCRQQKEPLCLLHNRVIWTPEVCHLGTYQCWVVLTFSWEPVEAKKIHFIFLIGSTMILYIYIYIHQWRCFYLETFWMEWNPKPNRRIVSYGEVVFFFLTPTWLDPSYWFFFFLPTPYLPPPSPFLLTIFPLQFPVFFLFSFVLFIVFLVISFFLSLCVCVCVWRKKSFRATRVC